MRRLAPLLALVLLATGMPVTANASASNPEALAALKRLLPQHFRQFSLIVRPGVDGYRVTGGTGRIRVEGGSPANLLTGVEQYLEQVTHTGLGWPGESVSRLPGRLPAPAGELRKSAVVAHRFVLNDTDDGYSGAYRSWADWERQLDLLALRGANEVLVTVGAEEVYRRTFTGFGYSDDEIRSWIPAPAHQPWWLLQNMSGFAGPPTPRLLANRAELGRRIVTRLRELGMTPVLPGYFGTVPAQFAAKNPGAKTVPQGNWGGFQRPDWLDPRDPHFARVAASFYAHQRKLFGDSTMYKMDLLHEGGQAGDVPVGEAATGVMNALQAAHPGATWVLLGWQSNPPVAIIDAVDRSKLFIVDGLSDRYAELDREQAWKGTPYAFGTIYNFGGHTTIGANAGVWAERFPRWLAKPDSALRGIALMPEGTGTNPAAVELFTELAWRDEPIDLASWFAGFARRRYGGADPHAAAAWDVLRRTAYAMPADGWSEAQDGLFEARPSLDATTAAAWSPGKLRYDPAEFAKAAGELLAVEPGLRGTSAYRFDLVDVTRQALTNEARELLPEIKAAYLAGDLAGFRALTGKWSHYQELLDELLGIDRNFLLGPWLASARAAAGSEREAARLEYDQRSIITTWGDRAAAEEGLHDYANRQLAGLESDFYAARWRLYFDSLEQALRTGTEPAAIDWFTFEDGWAHRRNDYPVEPSGDAHRTATEIWRLLLS
ncbi:alpha-N-acetylglucosaminidase [Amycolatopsis nigrescens]|uniref:alpha-N-acetylglucosaminidase n=1 Tax=Amycolatopsis nigrescens TaxID=381445 RepID=UPI00036FE88B|nr:alpha-N-acetylglucosaminidase [Amycolatopsis nigrescens]